jgi:arylsulfatase
VVEKDARNCLLTEKFTREAVRFIKAEKPDRDTIVVFLSDNGPERRRQSQAKPYRGLKWSALEGGTRVPCIVRWPGVVPGGQVSDALIAAIDLLPTLSFACGIDIGAVSKGGPVIDGVNVWATLLGNKDKPHPRADLLYWHGSNGFQAIRVGDWKLFLDRSEAELKEPGKGPALLNLAQDVAEMTDLREKFPDRVRAMRELARKRLADINRNIIPLGQ